MAGSKEEREEMRGAGRERKKKKVMKMKGDCKG